MRNDVRELLDRQAKWQKSRAALTWSEKLRQSLAMQPAMRSLRKQTAPKR